MKDEEKAEDACPAQPVSASDSSLIPHPSSLHRIRLGPPWQTTATPTGTRHARRFGAPRTLDPSESLWLVCAHVPGAAEVVLNGSAVGAVADPGPFAVEITALLRPRNEVVFAVASGAPLGAVALEVRQV